MVLSDFMINRGNFFTQESKEEQSADILTRDRSPTRRWASHQTEEINSHADTQLKYSVTLFPVPFSGWCWTHSVKVGLTLLAARLPYRPQCSFRPIDVLIPWLYSKSSSQGPRRLTFLSSPVKLDPFSSPRTICTCKVFIYLFKNICLFESHSYRELER